MYLVVHVLYLVVENPAATDCFGREQVVRYALPSPKLVRKFRLRDGTAYWALHLIQIPLPNFLPKDQTLSFKFFILILALC